MSPSHDHEPESGEARRGMPQCGACTVGEVTADIADFPLTAAACPHLEVPAWTGSTNADLRALASGPQAPAHLTTVLTTDQRAGRGRLDRVWEAAPGAALAVSVLLRVPGIPSASRGWIPLLAGVALAEAAQAQLDATGHSARVKWPNDVLVGGRKLSGILAEGVPGHPDTIVLGAGVNTRMSEAELPVPTAVSFAVLGLTADEDRLVADYVQALERGLDGLAAAGGDAVVAGLHERVVECCDTVGRTVAVSLPDGSTLRGLAVGLGDDGRLLVHADGAEVAVSAGDVIHVR